MAHTPRSVVIVGAGIVGISAAYFLSRAGVRPVVVDTAAPAAGATGASDGAVSVASKRPGVLMDLARAGVAFYAALARDGVLDGAFARRPTFLVAGTAAEEAVLHRHARSLADAGVAVRALSGPELAARLPMAAPSVRLAVEVADDGHAVGYEVVDRLRRAGGFPVLRNRRVVALDERDGRVRGVHLADGEIIGGDAVLVAAGTGSAVLLGLEDVLRPRRGQLLVTERADGGPRLPGPLMSARYLVSKGSVGDAGPAARSFGLVIDPLRTGQLLIGGTREEDGDARRTDLAAARHLLAAAADLCPAVADLRLLRIFAGVRVAVRDGVPLVGPHPTRPGLWIATGFEGDGICLGPLMGRVLQQRLCGEAPVADTAPLDPARFPAPARAA
ncbi:NAD(P)/FAD-dependent oxidoreductase [Azospirillum halopraeferens]|uniref:NAD(P)/FAD-dependent oxidoreductase n=1 Tax=Azospirillum halopraeferens TaxID=34010 RepID=UPI00048CCD5A|nr:FAD-binding oxidoreductase [Azospirillum halopraeferens]